jgi:hypothetical protein
MVEGNRVIIPVWHNVSVADVLKYSPPLADVKAVESKKGVRHVCRELLRRLRPRESPLIVARDELLASGVRPPVVTDEWWLDVVAASMRIDGWGLFPPEDSSWGRWSFPLPNAGKQGEARGVRLAWTALQLDWVKAADDQRISQITRPELVLHFIDTQPGLREACLDSLEWLAAYAPQLTIEGFGGEFEKAFDQILEEREDRGKLLLRASDWDQIDAVDVAFTYVHGPRFGPTAQFYRDFDYLVWLLSADSLWLPEAIRNLLRRGIRDWDTWSTSLLGDSSDRPFLRSLFRGVEKGAFRFTKRAKTDLVDLLRGSLDDLRLSDDPIAIFESFVTLGFIDKCIQGRRAMREASKSNTPTDDRGRKRTGRRRS